RRPAGESLRHLAKHLGRAMAGGDLRDHLAVVGGGAEDLRLERNDRERIVLERLGEIFGLDLRPLRPADLAEAIDRPMIVRPRSGENTASATPCGGSWL